MAIFDFLDGVFGLPESLNILCAALAIFLILLYAPLQEAKYGQTFGKKIMHLRVVEENGNKLNWTDAFFRYYIRLFTSLATFISFIFIIQKGQSITDMLCKTKVIEG